MNTPFATYDMHVAPLSEIDDGFNDIIILRAQNAGRCRTLRMLTNCETGTWFTETGEIRREVPIDYLKVKKWELRPRAKVQPNLNTSYFQEDTRASEIQDPESRESRRNVRQANDDKYLGYDDNFEREAVVQTEIDDNACFTIDGERYPAQNVKARVIPKCATFYL